MQFIEVLLLLEMGTVTCTSMSDTQNLYTDMSEMGFNQQNVIVTMSIGIISS